MKNALKQCFYSLTKTKMKDYKFLGIYKWAVVMIYKIKNKYYLENKKEIKKSDFIFIA